MLRILSLAAALSLAWGTASAAGPAPSWPAAPSTFASRAEIERAAADFPNSMGLQRRRLAAAIEARDAAAALDSARRLAAAGAGLSKAGRDPLGALIGAEAMRALAERFDSNAAPIAGSRLLAAVPPSHGLIEGLIWDRAQRRLYATSVTERRLAVVGPGGMLPIRPGEAGSLLGGAFDSRRSRLWAASAILDQTPRSEGAFNGLLSFAAARPSDVSRIPAPAGATPGDVALAPDGTVYASDGLTGGVYRCRPGCSALEPFVAPGKLFSAQGMAVSSDQKRLYVADRRYGIAVVDRSTGRIRRLAGDESMMLDGIDGLAAYGPDLVATQTAYAPQRIVRLRLSRDGLRVRRLDVLERAHPEWGEVTLGTVVGDSFVYVAGAQWERFGEGGAPKGEGPPAPTPVRSLKLR